MAYVRNDGGDSVLVYIRRLSENSPINVPNWDYHIMSSLPTNDNPRYWAIEDTPDRKVLTEYYWRLKTGPSDIKIQNGPFPSGSLQKSGILMVDLPNYKDDTYPSGAYFFTPFPLEQSENYIYTLYRRFQLGYEETTEWGTSGPDLNYISTSGDPNFQFRELNKEFGRIKTKQDFYSLPQINVSGIPRVVPQTGTIYRIDTEFGEEKRQNYTLSYSPNIEYFIYQSFNKDVERERSYFNPQLWASSSNDNLIESMDFDLINNGFVPRVWVTEDRRGMKSRNGLTYEKRVDKGVKIHHLPLHEISQWQYAESYGGKATSFPNAVDMDCKCTQIAYKIGAASKSAPDERWNNGNDATENSFDYQPGVLLFNRNPSHYIRVPECWPWSCRRYVVEKSVNPSSVPPNQKVVEYYSQDGSGNKTLINFDDIPKINISVNSFLGGTSKSLYVMNDDPIYFPLPYNQYGVGMTTESPPAEKNYINGYSCVRYDIPLADADDYAIEDLCGCDLDDEKIEAVVEVFPILHESVCKLVVKTGFLCYATKDCNAPKPSRVTKKIVYPFHSCRFNETLYSFAPKTELPNLNINIDSITLDSLRKGTLVYYETGSTFQFIDPSIHPDKLEIDISNSVTIEAPADYTIKYIVFYAIQPVKYSSDIYVYKFTKGQFPELFLTVSFNTVDPNKQGALIISTIKGNATDDGLNESESGIITGGDYYVNNGNKIFWNPTDKPRSEEFYEINSIGNAEGFLSSSLQGNCCNFCVSSQTSNGEAVVQSDKNCFELDKEGSNTYIGPYTYAGSCDLDERTACSTQTIQLRSSLTVISQFIGQNNPEFSLDAVGNIVANGSIIMQGKSVVAASGIIPSGELTSRVTGGSILAIESIMPPAEYIVNEL